MKILKSWLNDFIENDISNDRLVEILTLAGIDVEEIISTLDKNIIVAEIKKIEKHPNADKLQIATVNNGKEKLKIVCGARNIEIGQRVPLALPGATIGGQKIETAKIRGVFSAGMLCSEQELCLGEDDSGIYILPANYKIGLPLSECLESETIIDLDITANRGDCLSHLGIAREIAAFENSNIRKDPITLNKTDQTHISSKISLEVKNPNLCPQYLARVIDGVKIGPSPKWLQERLIACGAKPINNVVDVTNYILLDLGQPLHAFDLKKIEKSKIIIRGAKKNENITTLDGEIRSLNREVLVIADSDRPIAIAGVMGGKNSEVDDQTETIVLEAAEFDRRSIRKTSKSLSQSTEASYRFERGIDSGAIEYAINKAADLIVKTAGGKILQGLLRFGDKPKTIDLKIEYQLINRLLGLKLEFEEINHILRHLGFTITDGVATVPTWRHDIAIWQDLAEEIGRINRYDKIQPLALPKKQNVLKTPYYFIEKIKDLLVGGGYTETMNYPFLSEEDIIAAKLNSKNLLEIANPIQAENKYLRNSLIPGILKNIAANSSFSPIQLFEVGHVFSKTTETTNLIIATAGKSISAHDEIIPKLAVGLGVKSHQVKSFEFSRADLLKYKIKKPAVKVSEVNLTRILLNRTIDQGIGLKIYNDIIIYRSVSKYPAVTRDLAFIVDRSADTAAISDTIYRLSVLVNRVELFDEFVSDKLGKGKKNIAFHLFIQSSDRTLKDREADRIIKEIINNIEHKYNAKLRQ